MKDKMQHNSGNYSSYKMAKHQWKIFHSSSKTSTDNDILVKQQKRLREWHIRTSVKKTDYFCKAEQLQLFHLFAWNYVIRFLSEFYTRHRFKPFWALRFNQSRWNIIRHDLTIQVWKDFISWPFVYFSVILICLHAIGAT